MGSWVSARSLWIAVRAVAAVVAASGASLIITGRADALCDTGANRCFGRANFNPATAYTGGVAFLYAIQLTPVSPIHFSQQEMWVCTDGAVGAPCQSSFVETGWKVGMRFNGDPGTKLNWFWAARVTSPPAGCAGYWETFYDRLPQPVLGQTIAAKISFNGGNKWAVYRDGAWGYNAICQKGTTTYRMSVGGETSYDLASISGTATSLQKRSTDNQTWSYNWTGSTTQTMAPFSQVYWQGSYSYLRFYTAR